MKSGDAEAAGRLKSITDAGNEPLLVHWKVEYDTLLTPGSGAALPAFMAAKRWWFSENIFYQVVFLDV